MKKFIILIIFSFSLSLYSADELFPFGINHTVYSEFDDPADTTLEGYRNKYKRTIDSAATLGIKWWRAMRKFTWLSVEETEGQYNWDDEDSLVKWTGERDMNILPVIGEFYPTWAASDVPDEYKTIYPFNPGNWDLYMDFCSTMAERYDGDGVGDMEGLTIPIKYWECINEPYCTKQFLGDIGQYVEIFDSTRVALKRADPEAKLGGPCLTSTDPDRKWVYYNTADSKLDDTTYSYLVMLNDILDSIDTIDFITHHIYHWCSDGPELTMVDIRNIRNLIDNKPLWITECGYQWHRYWHEYTEGSEYPDTIFDRSWDFYYKYYDGKKDTAWIADEIATIYWVDTVTDIWTPDTQAAKYNELLDSISELFYYGENYKFFFFHIFPLTLGRPEGKRIIYDEILESKCYPNICTLIVKNFDVNDPLWGDPHLSEQLSIIRNSFKPLPSYYTIRNEILGSGDKTLSNITIGIDTIKTYQATGSITVEDFTIEGNGSNGGTVAMEAGENIYLGDGFKLEKGGYFYGSTNSLYGDGSIGMSSMKVSMPKAIKASDNKESKDGIPKVFSCAQNSPNPFASNTTIKYGLPKDVDVQLDIYDLIGRKVRTLINAKQKAGYKQVSWDGRTSDGAAAPKGIYFYTFKAGDYIKHRKMILIK